MTERGLESVRKELLPESADRGGRRQAKDPFRRPIEHENAVLGINGDNRIVGGIDDGGELGFFFPKALFRLLEITESALEHRVGLRQIRRALLHETLEFIGSA
jgi:hypothetical protein